VLSIWCEDPVSHLAGYICSKGAIVKVPGSNVSAVTCHVRGCMNNNFAMQPQDAPHFFDFLLLHYFASKQTSDPQCGLMSCPTREISSAWMGSSTKIRMSPWEELCFKDSDRLTSCISTEAGLAYSTLYRTGRLEGACIQYSGALAYNETDWHILLHLDCRKGSYGNPTERALALSL
jgi:hypothetical protein